MTDLDRDLDRDAVVSALDYFGSWLDLRRRVARVPGIQAAFLLGDEVVWSGAWGLADVEAGTAMTTRHLFRIASHSKTFTATAVLQLVEQGRLGLDDTVGSLLGYLAEASSPLAGVTVRELLSHAGGLFRDGQDGDHWQLFQPFPDVDRLHAIALDPGAAVLTPNERFKYSNIGYSLLGEVIERASGESYAGYVQRNILDPLGLRDTGPELDPRRAADLAAGYSALAYADHRVPVDHVDTRAMAAATGFYSTASDVVRYFGGHFLGDDRLLTDRSKRLMQQRLWSADGEARGYGLGLALTRVGERDLIGHGGGYPGHITCTMADPEDRFALSVLTNAIDGPAEECVLAGLHLLDLALQSPVPPGRLARFTGRFADLWGAWDVAALGGRLWLMRPTLPDPAAKAVPLDVADDRTLRVAGGPGYGSFGELMSYDFGDDGRVRSVRGESRMTLVPIDELSLGERVTNP